jgi:hypothetical protein
MEPDNRWKTVLEFALTIVVREMVRGSTFATGLLPVEQCGMDCLLDDA